MKIKSLSRYTLLAGLTGSLLLSSCHSTLHRAVERGDIATVRREIAYANTLSYKDKVEHLRGEPPAANLWWIVPTAMVTIPVDLALIFGTLGIYLEVVDDNTLTDLAFDKFYNRTPDAVRISYRKDYDDITYELMEAGADTPEHIRNWMYKNYRRYKPAPVPAPAPPPIEKKKPKQKTKTTPKPTPQPIDVGDDAFTPPS